MKLNRIIASAIAAVAFALTSFAVSDDTWGEAWNSKIGKSKFTVTASKHGWSSTPWTRGNCSLMFDNINGTSNDYLEYKSNFPVWVKLVIADDYESGKDVILKKYRMCAGSTSRAPKTWAIYGSKSADATWGDDSLVLIDSHSNIAGTTPADYDCSGNTLSYRTYFFYFEANNGDNLLQITELYLFGEVKEHEERIGYSVSTPYASCYDGYSHGITVTPTYPASGVTVEYSADNENWQAASPRYKAIGEYTIYYRLTATGFPTETGSRTISITTPPQTDTSILSAVRAAETYSGVTYHNAIAVGHESFGTGTEAFVDGIVAGQRNGWAGGSGYLTYEIDKSYRPGDTITIRSVTLSCDKSYAVNDSTLCMPRNWKLEAYDAANDAWVELVKYENNEYPEWTDDDLVTIGGKDCYQRTETFENTLVSRKYRFTIISGRTHLGELDLTGDIIMADNSKIQCLSEDYVGTYDGEAHGISVTVQNPDDGYTISYRALPSGAWTTTNPTFVDPIPASEAQQVEWKIEAVGFATVAGTNSVVLAYPDLTALLREAGSEYYAVEASGCFGTASQFVDGNENQRIGWVSGGTLAYVVSNTYETGKSIVVKGIGFALDYSNADASYGRYAIMPRYFALEGWNEEVQQWSMIVDRREDPLPEWTDEDRDKSNICRKTLDLDNDYAFRKYRLTMPNRRQHVAEIKLFGYAAASAPKEIFCTGTDYEAQYDGAKHGIAVNVTWPESGYKVEYSLTGTRGWSTDAIETMGLVSTPCPIYWRVSAPGYKTKTGVNTIQITDKPHTDFDILADVRAEAKAAGCAEMAYISASDTATEKSCTDDVSYLFNGVNSNRVFWRNAGGVVVLQISDDYRPGESVIATQMVFNIGTKVQSYQTDRLPQIFTLEASNDGEDWTTLFTATADNPTWDAETEVKDDYWAKAFTFTENKESYRRYRITWGKSAFLGEIRLYGSVGTAQPERPPHQTQGMMLIVR